MKRKNVVIISIAAVLVVGCVVGAILLTSPSGSEPEQPSETTFPITNPEDPGVPADTVNPVEPTQSQETTLPSDPSNPTDPDDPQIPTIPDEPTDPDEPTEPTDPDDPSDPQIPDVPVEDPDQKWKAEILVTREDGSVAHGAAVIATGTDGRQEYEATNENGLAVLELRKGDYQLLVFQDGQRTTATMKIHGEDAEISVQMKDQRTLYILLDVSGQYDCAPEELEGYPILVDAIKAKYPNAVYLTPENRYDAEFFDGDALLTVETFVQYYSAPDRYYASEVWAQFTAYQTCITVWDTDDGAEEIEIEYTDGNTCSIRIQNDYEYEYKDTVTVISESYYQEQRDWHFSQYSGWTDDLGYGYTMEMVVSTSSDRKVKASGANMKAESFWFDLNETRYNHYLSYVEEIFPYVDLWMTGNWNAEIEQLGTGQT